MDCVSDRISWKQPPSTDHRGLCLVWVHQPRGPRGSNSHYRRTLSRAKSWRVKGHCQGFLGRLPGLFHDGKYSRRPYQGLVTRTELVTNVHQSKLQINNSKIATVFWKIHSALFTHHKESSSSWVYLLLEFTTCIGSPAQGSWVFI